ncbi:FAD/NAD(P)-binding domain-containing protein [Cucurbitaria berberidis CBS 394.84]|uniref:FAD/NAD(P)-binding domain-containing protein n=1 Tax=Cucurbitaria berberidis CBS 394.84 TaxID=1168544 RepID=A0A9P4GUB1_9PLEO|nr:FAD/NAD(P)-binding domain-containing protein [Cucurbitaria berberidis CBS 394.84]KAF1851910.1 FAD/NAD(P)-binding domain-containing protein [Cucurbitaria berberidis CBS 394.84]
MSAIPNIPSDTPGIHANGIANGKSTSSFNINDAPVENLRPLKVIVIGAGYSGIYCGIRIPEKLRNVDLVIYEKNAGLGGTWWENRYLGCACDVPSHSYQYTFEPNYSWSSLYAPATEIQAYLERVAKKYSADRFVKLRHEIKECRWDDRTAKWNITIKNLATGETIQDQSDVLISARGNLNNPSWPEIDGLDTFKGEVMHSATWNEGYDFTDKRIGVIGSGSSSIQIVPSLQRLPGTQVSTFVRSKTWISPPFGQQFFDNYGFKGSAIPEDLRERFANDPDYYHKFRLSVEEDGNGIHAVTMKGTPLQLGAKDMFYQHMKKRLESKPEIFDALIPSFSPGCRRLTPGPGYLEALTESNVSFITSSITHISESAIHTADGAAHEIDALVCATGFKSSAPPPYPLIGTNGLTLTEKWSQRPVTYCSHSIAGFPNLFTMLGPNSAIGSGSLTFMIQNMGDYIIKAIRKIQKENIASLVVKEEREADFTEYVDAYFEGTVFADECRSWYKNKGTGEVVGLWPGSTLHCVEAMRSPRWEDFEYVYLDELEGANHEEGLNGVNAGEGKKRANRLAWLGNGWSVNQLEERDLAWYLYPEFLNKPVAPRPEEKESYRIRPFSY